jgi:hypothetical protein
VPPASHRHRQGCQHGNSRQPTSSLSHEGSKGHVIPRGIMARTRHPSNFRATKCPGTSGTFAYDPSVYSGIRLLPLSLCRFSTNPSAPSTTAQFHRRRSAQQLDAKGTRAGQLACFGPDDWASHHLLWMWAWSLAMSGGRRSRSASLHHGPKQRKPVTAPPQSPEDAVELGTIGWTGTKPTYVCHA